MQEVTCYHCRTVVQITPDDDHCSNCGEDLRGLLDPEAVSRYFCDRASSLASAGQAEAALTEAERGLAHHDLAELRLLSAILAEDLGRYDLMRKHVAAIPVDDSLRPEAEWLLRAHQDRQRALREGAKQVRHGSASLASPMFAGASGAQSQTKRHTRSQVWTGAAAVLIVILLSITWIVGRQPAGEKVTESTPQRVQSQTTVPEAAEPQLEAGASGELPAALPPNEDSGDLEPLPEPTATPALSTPSVPEDLVSTPTETAAIVDSNPRSVVVLSADVFDLNRFLRETGYPELAELPIDARVQEDKLILTGIVYLDEQRRQLLDLLSNVPGVQQVSTVDLLLRPKSTYTVEDGDTLWSIVYKIYGDVDRMEEFYLYNIDVAPSPDALKVGDELRVPPIE